ncbi:M1 family metallopeptidase [Algoriphagus sp. CAU 1675]|uniref:M1 family metallopeptidase n=1 Tax=Algoriphagus sp. CAU 1675 TaxID=3032597 RepID=UPI0023DB7198|nr:M1 family metallopeptidase [Algoriphagus sp. CAU 1675]MDF2158734.1 M1 family metallopeptidase [Algoriphagus sp. CAU 1675]
MITMPKNILQISIRFFLISWLALACKSPESLPSKERESVATEQESLPDSVQLIAQIMEKQSELTNYKASATRKIDILHTELDLSFDFEKSAVLGKARIKMKPYVKPQREVVLDAKDFDLSQISVEYGGRSTKAGYRYDEKLLTVYLPQTFTAEDTFLLEINYVAYPDRNSGSGSEAITDTKGLYFIDPLDEDPYKPTMIWTQGETNHNSKWFPTIDQPNERFTQLIKLTVPDSMVSISNGELMLQEKLGDGMRRDHWEMKLPHAPYLAALAIGDFGKVEAEYEGIPLGYYVEKGFEKGAEIVFKHTPEMMGYFSDLLGVKFPWPKYDQIVVRDFVSGAMENTTASIFMEELRLNEREAIDSEWDYIIAHELFHQWFGDYVTTESWANLTLNEGFANYSEYLWNEHKYGLDEAKLKLVTEMETYFQEARSKQVDLVRFQYEDAEDMFDSHSYAKGGVILHMLRKYLGDEIFFSALNLYLKSYAFESVEVHQLRLAMEKVSGEDLNWFFNQWYLDKGHPELRFEVDYSMPENILITAYQMQDLSNSPLYRIPFEVSWYENGERKSKYLTLDRAFQQFALENKAPVTQVYLDEGKDLLIKKHMDPNPESMLRQFNESQLGVARYEALDSLESWGANEALLEIIPQALRDPFWSVRESALILVQSHSEWLTDHPELEEQVFEMAESDPKNSVRAGAIDALATFDPSKYHGAFLRYANDSSYLISSSALMGLISSPENSVDEKFMERFAEDNNFRIVVPVADFYLGQMIPGKGSWFRQKVQQLGGEGLYYFLGYYGEYFVRFPDEGRQEAVSFLLDKLRESGQNFIRLGAFQALMGFVDDEAVVREIRVLVDREQDEELKAYFEYFLQALEDEN